MKGWQLGESWEVAGAEDLIMRLMVEVAEVEEEAHLHAAGRFHSQTGAAQ